MKNKIRIIYVSTSPHSNISNWSGLTYFIGKCLKDHFTEVYYISGFNGWDNLHLIKKIILSLKDKLYKVLKKKYHLDRDPLYVNEITKQISTMLKSFENIESIDYIFSDSSINLCRLKTKVPKIAWLDATFDGMINFYPEFKNLCYETLMNGHRWEQKYLESCKLAIFTSEWAAKTALENYNIDKNKVIVIPYGANLLDLKSEVNVSDIWKNKNMDSCNLLFVGVDWERKGGPFAVEVVKELNSNGVKAILHIVGCNPIMEPNDFIEIHGFLSKSNPDHTSLLEELFTIAHFFVLPAKAECYGLVFCEAMSYGLPCFALDVGGISTIIQNGESGYLFDVDSTPSDFVKKMKEIWIDKNKMKKLSKTSYEKFKSKHTWNVAGESLKKILI